MSKLTLLLFLVFYYQEKESLITELRKELRVSDDEHRELLSRVNADDTIRRIRSFCKFLIPLLRKHLKKIEGVEIGSGDERVD